MIITQGNVCTECLYTYWSTVVIFLRVQYVFHTPQNSWQALLCCVPKINGEIKNKPLGDAFARWPNVIIQQQCFKWCSNCSIPVLLLLQCTLVLNDISIIRIIMRKKRKKTSLIYSWNLTSSHRHSIAIRICNIATNVPVTLTIPRGICQKIPFVYNTIFDSVPWV